MPNRTPPCHKLHFTDIGRDVDGLDGETVFQAARRGGVRIVGACGGRGTCGSCMVRITAGEVENYQGSAETLRKRWQRACLIKARGDCRIEIAPRSLAPVVRAEVEQAGGEALSVDPIVTTADIAVPPASLSDPAGDVERLLRVSPVLVQEVDLAAARHLPRLLRRHGWMVAARFRGDRIVGFAPPGRPLLGLAVDLGTTNAAAFLLDLTSGKQLAGLGIENPQAAWGADVISRINHAIQGVTAAEELRAAILGGLNALAHDLCQAIGADQNDIVDAAVCGNTAMHHLLAGLPVEQLGRSPFVAAVTGVLDVDACALGLKIAAGAQAHLVANVGGFVGGDHVAALLATEDRWGKDTSLVMDIGTNTEISLIHEGRILSASAPSGPALEGGHISCGMRAAEGAIEKVGLSEGRLTTRLIGSGPAVGLCGSGVLDTLAALFRAGIVDAGGRIKAGHPDVAEADGKRHVQLAPGVHFTQHDIRAVQLAKAAIRTATDLLLHHAGLRDADIGHFIIAGAFGHYIDVESGIAIGMFPDLPRQRFVQVGNAAGLGVRRILVSRRDRQAATELAARCHYVELNGSPDFQPRFINNIRLGAGSGQERKAS